MHAGSERSSGHDLGRWGSGRIVHLGLLILSILGGHLLLLAAVDEENTGE
jgi:hypothetical protein